MKTGLLKMSVVVFGVLLGVPVAAFADAVDSAAQQLGKPYLYGASGTSRFDCSSLTQYAYSQMGIELPRTSLAQSTEGVLVAPPYRRGDLIFFETESDKPGVVTHVGIYERNNIMIDANSYYDVVRRDDISDSYWAPKVLFARRITSHQPIVVTNSLTLRLFNIDDTIAVKVNGNVVGGAAFATDVILNLSSDLHKGDNEIEIDLLNGFSHIDPRPGGWTYGYQFDADGHVLSESKCGSIGVTGCDNNDQTPGVVFVDYYTVTLAEGSVAGVATPVPHFTMSADGIPIAADGQQLTVTAGTSGMAIVTFSDNSESGPGIDPIVGWSWTIDGFGQVSTASSFGYSLSPGPARTVTMTVTTQSGAHPTTLGSVVVTAPPVQTFTDPAAFGSTIGSHATATFDDRTAGFAIPNSATPGGISYSFNAHGFTGTITNAFLAVSPPNELGVDRHSAANQNYFFPGESVTLTFPPTTAIGAYFTSSPNAGTAQGFISISTPVGTALSGDALPAGTFGFPAFALRFVGLQSTTPFTQATFAIVNPSPGNVGFAIDNITFGPTVGASPPSVKGVSPIASGSLNVPTDISGDHFFCPNGSDPTQCLSIEVSAGGSVVGTLHAPGQIQNVTATSAHILTNLATPGIYSLIVVNPDGSKSVPFDLTVPASGTRPPAIQKVDPSVITAWPSIQSVSLSGTGFVQGLSLLVGLPGGGTLTLAGTQIQAVSPSSISASVIFSDPGTYTFTVINSDGGTSFPFSILVGAASATAPRITGLSPAVSGGNTFVTIGGANFRCQDPQNAAGCLSVEVRAGGALIGILEAPNHVGRFGFDGSWFDATVTFPVPGVYELIVVNPSPNSERSAPFQISVTPPDPAVIAHDDDYVATQGTTLSVPIPGILSNDVLPSLTRSIVIVVPPMGSLSVAGGGLSYTPPQGFVGIDTFEYYVVVADGAVSRQGNTARVSITVGTGVP